MAAPPKKNYVRKSSSKKTVIITKSRVSAKSTLFPEKLAKANAILAKTKFLGS